MTYGTNVSVINLEWQKTTFHHNAPSIAVILWDKHLRRRHDQDLVKNSKNTFLADDKKQMIINTLEKK